jgi:hypothetical protein
MCSLSSELGETESQRQILEILSGDAAVGRPILTTPDVPADRVRALRKAFDETLADPQFLAAAKQASIYINPMGGEELSAMVERIAGPSERVLTMLRQATEGHRLNPRPLGGLRRRPPVLILRSPAGRHP